MSLLEEFRRRLDRLGLGEGRALLAVSGGADSVALLALMTASRADHRLDLVVAHADHGIHPESAAVADRVRGLATSLGVPTQVGSLGLGAGTSETRARVARWDWLQRLRLQEDAAFIFTAHHADDQAETVLMRVLKGSGPAGLSAMAERQGGIVRPLLPFRREQLVQYLRSQALDWWEDPANADPAHLRSWLRIDLLPAIRSRLPEVDRKLVRTARQASLARAGWDALLDELPGLGWRQDGSGGSVAASALAGYASPLRLSILMAMARRVGLTLGPSRARRVFRGLAGGQSGTRIEVGAGWFAELAFDRLHLRPAAAAVGDESELRGAVGRLAWGDWRIAWGPEVAPAEQARDGMTAWFIPGTFAVRRWREGDRVHPLRGAGSRPAVRCFQDARVPRSRRATWPVFDSGGEVVWIPGVCRSDQLLPAGGAESIRIDVHAG
jgi:tRNA(Ile)-lysidine synthase